MKSIAPEWGTAEVASLTSAVDPHSGQEFAAFTITTNTNNIYSLDPTEDYEVNPYTIQGWRMIFLNDSGENLGHADYFTTLNQLEPYIIERNNDSILVRQITETELEQLFESCEGNRGAELLTR